MATTDIIHVSGSLKPSKPAVIFLGGNVDDYIQIDAAAAGQLLEAYTSGTWAAWIMNRSKTQTGTIIGMGDKSVVEFIELNVEAGKLVARCTDNTVAQWVLTTDNVVVPTHEWVHVALVHNSAHPRLYVNGVEVAQTMSTATAVSSFIAACGGLDSGRIGAANKEGNDSVTQEFAGAVADLRLYGGTTTAGALTQAQVIDVMNGIGTTTGLYNHWKFDEDYTDAGTGNDTGTSVGANVLSCGACSFDSKFRAQGFVTADYPVTSVSDNGNRADCWVIKAA
jgi:hypothetical protein